MAFQAHTVGADGAQRRCAKADREVDIDGLCSQIGFGGIADDNIADTLRAKTYVLNLIAGLNVIFSQVITDITVRNINTLPPGISQKQEDEHQNSAKDVAHPPASAPDYFGKLIFHRNIDAPKPHRLQRRFLPNALQQRQNCETSLTNVNFDRQR